MWPVVARPARALRQEEDAKPACPEWVLLPGLFSWDEVYALFRAEAGRDNEWRFSVHRASTDESTEPLYSVRAARLPGTRENKEG